MTTAEVNFDGLVGPTHNYGGLSVGNVASMTSKDGTSNPKGAALQGLAKMRALHRMGLYQGVLPPHERPLVRPLRAMGFSAPSDAALIEKVAKADIRLLRNVSSASAMWTANAATVSPSADTADGKVHFTPANLAAMYHRALEHPQTSRLLRAIFPDPAHFVHHQVIDGGGAMGDEGAANHGRFAASHGAPGLGLFVYGRSAFETLESWRFLPRQALEASQAITRQHGVRDAVFLRQSRAAVEAGAFHNDVVGVTNGTALLYHEDAYEDQGASFDAIRQAGDRLGFEPQFIEVPRDQVPLGDAITSYLFNSQLVSLPDGGMALILPGEAEATASTADWVASAIAGNGPITHAHYFDLKQSMKNGGGPACLRLRVVLTAEERAGVLPGAILDDEKIDALEAWVKTHYRDALHPDDLADPDLLDEVRTGLDALTQLLGLGAIYDFQREDGGSA